MHEGSGAPNYAAALNQTRAQVNELVKQKKVHPIFLELVSQVSKKHLHQDHEPFSNPPKRIKEEEIATKKSAKRIKTGGSKSEDVSIVETPNTSKGGRSLADLTAHLDRLDQERRDVEAATTKQRKEEETAMYNERIVCEVANHLAQTAQSQRVSPNVLTQALSLKDSSPKKP